LTAESHGAQGDSVPAASGVGVASRERRWRLLLLSLLVPVAFLAVGIHTRNDYGETWDEQFDQDIGRFYWDDWAKNGVKGLQNRFIPLQRNYGPFFDVVVVAGHELLYDKLKLVTNPIASYHMPVLLVAASGLWLVFWFGYRLWGAGPGFVASGGLALMPQFIAHSQSNLKDMPLAVFFMGALFILVEAVRRNSLRMYAVAGVAVGLTYAIKLHAVFLAPIVVLWQLPEIRLDPRRWAQLFGGLLVTGVTAFLTILLVWPYYRHDPVARFLETLRTFSSHEYNEYVFYLGQHFRAHDVPWHFPFVMLGVNTPIIYLVFLAVGLGFLVRRLTHHHPERSSLVLVVVWLLVPAIIQVVSGSIKLDGVRHYLLVLPAMALLSGYAVWNFGFLAAGLWRRGRWPVIAYTTAVGFCFLAVLRGDWAIHPYQAVFFNRLVGGTAGAQNNFELDYWGASLRETAAWMNTNLPAGSRIWLTIPGQHFFKIDRNRFRFVNDLDGRPNYKVNLIRGLLKTFDTEEDYRHPRRKPIFAVSVHGADLVQVFEYEQFRDLPDGTSLSPGPPVTSSTAQGLLVQEYSGSKFEAAVGEASVWRSLAFDCQVNPYANRAVSLRAVGLLRVPEAGLYSFEVTSDDEAVLFLNDRAVFTNASLDTTRRTLRLGPGIYGIRLDYCNGVGEACLRVSWGRTAQGRLEILGEPWLSHLSGAHTAPVAAAR